MNKYVKMLKKKGLKLKYILIKAINYNRNKELYQG